MRPSSKILSDTFSKIIRQWLTPEELQTVIERNESPSYKLEGLCATHDFCDANQAMIDAHWVCFARDINSESDDDNERVNEAWNLSKINKFK